MHPNKAFRQTSAEDNLAFARDRGFGVLTLAGKDYPLASHIPFVVAEDGASFGAHLVRSNPIYHQLDDPQSALMVISGADAYISPDWYGVADQVPTWNYVAVHLRGRLEKLPDNQLRPHLEQLSARFENELQPKPPWKIEKVDAEALAKMMKFIAPVKFTIESTDGTWKLGQNKPDQARVGAAEALSSSSIGQLTGQLSDLMRKG